MLLRPGANAKQIIQALKELSLTGYNYTADDENYVLWIAQLEVRLNEWFTGVPTTLLYSERFWQIRSGVGLRPHEMRRAECARVIGVVDSLHETLTSLATRFEQAPGAVAVLDTNVLLHYKPLTDVIWTDVLGTSAVTLVIPIRVLAEIDDKKAAPNNHKLRTRARTRINMLERLVLGEHDVQPVRENVNLTVVGSVDLDPEARRRPSPPSDVEILDTCRALAAYAPNAVSIVTGDLAMKVQARASGISITPMPDDCYQPLGDVEESPPEP